MIDIYILQQLAAYAECGTLSAAAEKLHTSQPAMTRSMKKLEDELGVTLFERSKNHISLNSTGRKAAEYANRVLEADRDFIEKVRQYDRSLHTLSVGFCAPVPQEVFTPILNSIFDGMTISADMKDDATFFDDLENGIYQLAITHSIPDRDGFYYKKCGEESLFVSVLPSDPLTFYPEIHLKDLDGLSILLLTKIGFWANMHRAQTPHTKYLPQIDRSTFTELAEHSAYPIFASDYFIRRGERIQGRIDIPIADPECHTEYYLVCVDSEKERFRRLFSLVHEKTVY
ncbi:MAG: LysR family transcriptional regulator [Ruminococcus flavefaciens]|nr:MAG: HTH-type transcriptional regulator TdfR [Firmicutes bacterium ADurb.BinA205]